MLHQKTSPAPVISELPLKLVKKCLEVYGAAFFEEDIGSASINIQNEEDIASVTYGKDFGFIRTFTGKVQYCGKHALGMKQSGGRTGKWSDLILTKSPKVKHIAVGHEGLHAILLTEDGSAFFIGTARRGEDGDQSKVRRQPKSMKPKKIIRVEGHHIVTGACNNGTTALITSNGELIMFGKDTAYADPITGLVTSLKGQFIIQIALGKAHSVVLTNKGEVYTFGINNKYQCGRDFISPNHDLGSTSNITAMDTCIQEERDIYSETQIQDTNHSYETDIHVMEPVSNICPTGMHSWHEDMCMICSLCHECTGYSISCLSAINSDRIPGQECGCGEGDSGCLICGCCRICAREVVDNSELADLAGIMKLDLMFNDEILMPQKCKLDDIQMQGRIDEKKRKSKKLVHGLGKQIIKSRSSKTSSNRTSFTGKTETDRQINSNRTLGIVKDQSVFEADKDATRMTCLPPAKIVLPTDSPVIQIACGLHHSLLLLQNGQVYTFGSNLYGQLGCGDILTKCRIQLVRLPCSAIQIAAGSNHSIILTSKGEVFTFGNGHKGQLGRGQSGDIIQSGQSSTFDYNNPHMPWYSFPGSIPNIGPKYGRKATWVGASGDQTFLKLDENLINSVSIMKSSIIANKNAIILLPNDEEITKSFKCIVIDKQDGHCNSFKSKDQVDFINKLVCMDHIYDVLWSYNPCSSEFTCYNVIASELQNNIFKASTENNEYSENKCKTSDIPSILSPELALPAIANYYVTRFQAAINLLSCLDILTSGQELQLPLTKRYIEESQFVTCKQLSKEDFQVVNRFESHGGGWGYSGHSIEAIRFMADTDVLLGGYGLFGGRGEYSAKLKLLDIGSDGGEQEIDGELLAETDDIPYECGPRQKFAILFDEPIHVQAHRWYVAWCRISGPSSDCGSSGQTMIVTEDQVIFSFKSSKKSNNGTDVNAGQIPQLLYKIVSHENQAPPKQADNTNSTYFLSYDFSRTVSKECFHSLSTLLQWSWNTFKCGIIEDQISKNMFTDIELNRLVYISRASLRLLCIYINEIYPRRINKHTQTESATLAECVADIRTLLKQILSDTIPAHFQQKKINKKQYVIPMMNNILDECHNTFVACFHAFYPTANLKWICLCDLLQEISEDSVSQSPNSQRLICAVLCALCAPYIRIRSIFPIVETNTIINSSISSDNSVQIVNRSELHRYPILVEHMTNKTQVEAQVSYFQWNEVLEYLINLACVPVSKKLNKCNTTNSLEMTKYCCYVLAKVIAELVFHCSVTEEELQSYGRSLYITPSRFTRINQSKTWNTGNGSPDAICFQVDREGISIVGVGVYGGIGHYEYELELLEDTSSLNGESNLHAHRWNCLQVTRGSYGPDDFAPDIMELKFESAISIKENVKYAIRLRNHGGRTNNGDGGLSCVKGPDNTTFTFSTCALSFNGTTLIRGQIPLLLYYSCPLDYGRNFSTRSEERSKRAAISMTNSIFNKANNLLVAAREKADEVLSANILNNSSVIQLLLPLVLAHISSLATSDPKSALQILNLIQDILPHVAALNLLEGPLTSGNHSLTDMTIGDSKINTTSRHYALVESDHPYKPSSVANYRVKFPNSVKWMSLEFDPACSTIQPEDSVQLYVPKTDYINEKCRNNFEDTDNQPLPYWPILHKFSGSLQWPTNSVILPGNEVIFSLETASDYLKDDRFSAYGFKCLVIGYDWPLAGNLSTGLKRLEAELSFLGGMCAASLMKKDLFLPPAKDEDEIDVEEAESIAAEIFMQHKSILAKGLSFSSPPTVQQALDGILPYNAHSNEKLFLRDFVNCLVGSSGGRLAQWLQPGSRVDPSKCQVLYSREDIRFGWPTVIIVITRDQYADVVYVPNMKVEIKAIPMDKKELAECNIGNKMRKVGQGDQLTFGGLPAPPLHHLYEPTVRDKMCFHSITIMKPYQNYSFEELRYICPPMKRSTENVLVKTNCDGSYSATWSPASVGYYSVIITIDGYDMNEVYKVEVKEPPQGITPPNQNTLKKPTYKPNKLRKFVARNSAGLRIRAHPSLQSEQVGVVHVNGTIAFIDEIHNDDGVWLRLSADTVKQYCTISLIEAWCLQYNQHLGKTLLLPVEEAKSILNQVLADTVMLHLPEIQRRHKKSCGITYQVIKCGASGHNIRSRPSLKAPPIGMLVLGNKVSVTEYIINSDGCWVLLDEPTKKKYCLNIEGDAWSLAVSHGNIPYLGNVIETESSPNFTNEANNSQLQKKGFNFSSSLSNSRENIFSFSKHTVVASSSPSKIISTNPFIFGDNSVESHTPSEIDKTVDGSLRHFKGDHKSNKNSENFDEGIPVKCRSECNANINGSDITATISSHSNSRSINLMSNSHSVAVPVTSQITRGSNQSHSSTMLTNITKDVSPSCSHTTKPKEVAPIPTDNSINKYSQSSVSPESKSNPNEHIHTEFSQIGTQTSPDKNTNTPRKGQFSIGFIKNEEKVSPKLLRKDKNTNKLRSKRSISPAHLQQLPTNKPVSCEKDSIKQAMSPSVAESLRAVFAAFLWHEGIVHDAMACASFLKFHPSLPKQGALVVTRNKEKTDRKQKDISKEEKARQRHSVEVASAGQYLHIQPSTLESLTRSAVNASVNRNRRKVTESIIKEGENCGDNCSYQTKSVLPPALKSLVCLWEEVTSNCLLAISQQIVPTSAVQNKISKSVMSENTDKKYSIDRDNKKCKKKKIPSRNYLEDIGLASYLHSSGSDTSCELCSDIFPHPITYHMHQEHPGCGQHAGGKGYNSGGNYCLGWAGNCGDGGVPGSSWYLLCENCRQKYMKTYIGRKQINMHHKNSSVKKSNFKKVDTSPSFSINLEPHITLKNNAMFLLNLASSAESNIRHIRKSSMSVMTPVSEKGSSPETFGSFGPLPPFQCLNALNDENISISESAKLNEFLNNYQEISDPSTTSEKPSVDLKVAGPIIDNNKELKFHRSVSMGTNGFPCSKPGYDGRIILMRKRNNSSCETTNEGVSSLLCNPSNALQKLTFKKKYSTAVINNEDNESTDDMNVSQRPVLQFILQQHDLNSLQFSMKRAIRKAMCRVHAMQAFNWLLRSVTQPICLHDLLWWFFTSLTPVEVDLESAEDNRPLKKEDEQDLIVREHPLFDITIAGDAVHPLPSTFHSLLQTIADLMVLLPMGSALQQIAVRCWGIRFTTTDQTFLHRSQVFSNISKILSKSEEIEALSMSMHESYKTYQATGTVECLKDLTSMIEIKASSRQAMVGSLTDNSTETFWESGDEDRNKTKTLTIICCQNHHPSLVCVHIDNCRDIGNKVSTITFFSGKNTDEIIKLRTIEVEPRLLGGWVTCSIIESSENVIKLELKGPDNSVRVRQIRVLGNIEGESLQVGRQYNSLILQQKNCEAETLRVFRLITSQVFGKLLESEDGQYSNHLDTGNLLTTENEKPFQENNDLREHMVGILFSRSKLTHLQKQVIVHIVHAIRKETERVFEEWESNLCASTFTSEEDFKNSDTYCFEMLSMVLALSGSSVGRTYLSHQCGLLKDLITLLHTGSARVQRQVTSLLRRMLSEITPETFAKVVGVEKLPIKDFSVITTANKDITSEALDVNRVGILDVFLGVIAKALTIQIKIRGKNENYKVPRDINIVSLATASIPVDTLNKSWWLKGYISKSLALILIRLIKDMASGKLSENWANITKSAIAENILRLTCLRDEQKLPNSCLQTSTLWLALASLCVLDKDHVERLTSGQWTQFNSQTVPPRPTCTNHDDGETVAIIQCNICSNLCADCDRYLHLHRQTKHHQRQVCKEEEEAIKVELHEGCGRIKLFWLLAVADSSTLKALIEFREGGNRSKGAQISGMCRFCGTTGNSGLLAIGNICADQDCQEYGKEACTKLLGCGHMCGGVLGETKCLPCLHGCFSNSSLKQDSDDMCMICFTEALSCAPAIQLNCGHVFHSHCCKAVLMKKWVGPRITFSFLLCPICKAEIEHETLEEILSPLRELYKDVRRKALMRLEYEGLHSNEIVTTSSTNYQSDSASYAMDRYAYYVCYKCNKAYYGGEARCDAELGENYDPAELVCGACSDIARAQMCPKHGTDFLEYKCRYCCSVAIFFCFGTTHFCNLCHDDFQRVTNLPKSELPICPAGPRAIKLEGDECPLHIKHPPTGEEFALGCGICRNAHTF